LGGVRCVTVSLSVRTVLGYGPTTTPTVVNGRHFVECDGAQAIMSVFAIPGT
jgi:hypothetical protein